MATKQLPEWAQTALNGGSHRKPYPWRFEPGDALAGELVEVREVSSGNSRCKQLTIRVEGGSQSGEPLTPGDWLTLRVTGSVLRHWMEREQPQIGDRVAIECRGKSSRHAEFVAGVHRSEDGWS